MSAESEGWYLASHILDKKRDDFIGVQASLLNILKDHLTQTRYSKTRFTFMPVASQGKVAASLSIRDLLIIADRKHKVGELASSLITVNESMRVVDALKFMVEKDIRNLVTLRQDDPYVINDRRILEFLLGY